MTQAIIDELVNAIEALRTPWDCKSSSALVAPMRHALELASKHRAPKPWPPDDPPPAAPAAAEPEVTDSAVSTPGPEPEQEPAGDAVRCPACREPRPPDELEKSRLCDECRFALPAEAKTESEE